MRTKGLCRKQLSTLGCARRRWSCLCDVFGNRIEQLLFPWFSVSSTCHLTRTIKNLDAVIVPSLISTGLILIVADEANTNCKRDLFCSSFYSTCGRHTPRHSLSKTILRATLEDGQRRDRRGNSGWTAWKSRRPSPCQNFSSKVAYRRKDWKRVSAKSSLMSLRRTNRSRDLTELNLSHIVTLRKRPFCTPRKGWREQNIFFFKTNFIKIMQQTSRSSQFS